jgi:hypothetical protein
LSTLRYVALRCNTLYVSISTLQSVRSRAAASVHVAQHRAPQTECHTPQRVPHAATECDTPQRSTRRSRGRCSAVHVTSAAARLRRFPRSSLRLYLGRITIHTRWFGRLLLCAWFWLRNGCGLRRLRRALLRRREPEPAVGCVDHVSERGGRCPCSDVALSNFAWEVRVGLGDSCDAPRRESRSCHAEP